MFFFCFYCSVVNSVHVSGLRCTVLVCLGSSALGLLRVMFETRRGSLSNFATTKDVQSRLADVKAVEGDSDLKEDLKTRQEVRAQKEG